MNETDVRTGDPRGFVGEECLALLAELQGRPIVAVRRTYHVYKGEVDRTKGWIEVAFQGRSVLFREASNGYHLRAIPGRWVDPFEGPQEPENVSYIEQYGKLTAFDVSEELPYRHLIGQAAKSIEPLRDLAGEVWASRLRRTIRSCGPGSTATSSSSRSRLGDRNRSPMMRIEIDIPEYKPSLGLRLPVVSGAVIESAPPGSEFVIRANADGLRLLACHLLTLAQTGVPAGSHLHYDPDATLEPGSAPFIFERSR